MNPDNRDRFRQELVGQYEPVAQRLLRAYGRLIPILRGLTNSLVDDLGPFYENNKKPHLPSLSSYERLLNAVEEEVTAFAGMVRGELGLMADDAIELASGHALDQTLAVNGTPITSGIIANAWNQPDPQALRRLIGYVDSDAMRSKFAFFGTRARDAIGDTVLGMVAQGKNPRFIARSLERWLLVPYNWADNMARTVQVYSYRMANHATYANNSDILEGWVWQAALDERTCMSCVSQHGRLFDLKKPLNDHHRGRCTPLPVVKGTTWRNSYQTGVDWFNGLSPTQQRAQMNNNALFDGWQRGEFQLSDLSRPYTDDVYGEMLRQASYRELRG